MLRSPDSDGHAVLDMPNERHVAMHDDDAMADTSVIEKPPIVLLSQQLPSQPHQNDILQQLYHSYQTQTGQHCPGTLNHPVPTQLSQEQLQHFQQQLQQTTDASALYRRKRSLSAPLMLKGQVGTRQVQATLDQASVTGADEDVDMDQDVPQSLDQDPHREIRRSPPTVSDQATQEGAPTRNIARVSSHLPQPTIDYSKIYANREIFWASLPRYHRHKIYASIGQSRPGDTGSGHGGIHHNTPSKSAISKVAHPSSQSLPRSIRCFYKLTPSQQWTTISNLSSSSSSSSSLSSATSLRPSPSDLLSHSPWDAAVGIGRIVLRSSSSPSGVTKATQRSRLPIHIRHYTSRTHRRPGICVRPPMTPQNESARKQPSSSSVSTSISQPQLSDWTDPVEQEYSKNHSSLHPHHAALDYGSPHVLDINASVPPVSSTLGAKDMAAIDRLAAASLRNRLWARQRGGLLNIVGSGDGDDSGGGGTGSTTTKSNVDRLVEELNRWQV